MASMLVLYANFNENKHKRSADQFMIISNIQFSRSKAVVNFCSNRIVKLQNGIPLDLWLTKLNDSSYTFKQNVKSYYTNQFNEISSADNTCSLLTVCRYSNCRLKILYSNLSSSGSIICTAMILLYYALNLDCRMSHTKGPYCIIFYLYCFVLTDMSLRN